MADEEPQWDEEFVQQCVELEAEHLDEEMASFSGNYAYWTQQYADACRTYELRRRAYDLAHAARLLEVRESARADGTKMTVDEVNAMTLLAENVNDAHVAMVAADATRIRLRGIVESLGHKKDLMQSLGAKARIEMQYDPAVRRHGAPSALLNTQLNEDEDDELTGETP